MFMIDITTYDTHGSNMVQILIINPKAKCRLNRAATLLFLYFTITFLKSCILFEDLLPHKFWGGSVVTTSRVGTAAMLLLLALGN